MKVHNLTIYCTIAKIMWFHLKTHFPLPSLGGQRSQSAPGQQSCRWFDILRYLLLHNLVGQFNPNPQPQQWAVSQHQQFSCSAGKYEVSVPHQAPAESDRDWMVTQGFPTLGACQVFGLNFKRFELPCTKTFFPYFFLNRMSMSASKVPWDIYFIAQMWTIFIINIW